MGEDKEVGLLETEAGHDVLREKRKEESIILSHSADNHDLSEPLPGNFELGCVFKLNIIYQLPSTVNRNVLR